MVPGLHQIPELPETLVKGRERSYLTYFYRHLSADPASVRAVDIDEYVRTYSPSWLPAANQRTDQVTEQPLIEHRRVASDDAEIHYVVAGDGECVVLLHGFPETWLAWRKVIPVLAARYRIIAPDLRGLGESSRPPSGYDKKTVARDVNAVIAAEAVSRYHLVGADMGGSVAFPLAMDHEDQVRSFVFLSSGLAGVGLERLYDYSTIGVNAWYWTLFQHETYGPMLTSGHVEELLTTWAYRGSALNPDAISDDIIKTYLSHYATTDGWRTALQYYTSLATDATDNRGYLADGRLLQMPTLGIDGEEDGRLSTATLAQVAVNVQGTLIPRCKHWIAEEQPDRLAAVLLDFFAATTTKPSAVPHA